MKKIGSLVLASAVLASRLAMATDFGGQFELWTPDGTVYLNLQQDEQGALSGSMSDGVTSMRLLGQASGAQANGIVKAEYPPDLGFVAQFGQSGNQLLMQLYPMDPSGNPVMAMAQNMTFQRAAAPVSAAAGAGAGSMQQATDQSGNSNVFINGKALTRQQVAGFEQQYRTKLIAGRFWYDDKCGAWGMEGGPTLGFILPSLPLPGPMPANVSGGGTGIFINGREIHPIDRQVLVGMFGTAIPGRYWLDGYGNLGVEGGGFLVNLAVAAQQLQQRTTQTGSATVSTGPEGAMFSGTNLSTGKPTFWYAGM